MAKKQDLGEELNNLKTYLTQTQSEAAKRHLVYPLFKKLFPDKFKTESEAQNADVYIEGKLVVELKTTESDWLAGFYQALHYQKKGLTFNSICVIAEKFIAVWKVNHIPEYAVIQAHTADAMLAPNAVGKENAKKTQKHIKDEILQSAVFKLTPADIAKAQKELRLLYDVYEFKNVITNLDADRIQINTLNFIETIEQMKRFFDDPIEAVHTFYAMVGYWDITSVLAESDFGDELRLVGYKGKKFSEPIFVAKKYRTDFENFVKNRFVFTNEGSGLTVDYYFSRFDEVLARLNPEYAKQHGIFFTDDNLSKFALWFVQQTLDHDIGENYVVFDPAGGSGNLVSSYRGKLKHKIVSELQPDLLRTIERRMKVDPYHVETGFTIIPKTSENKGLNFLDISAKNYLNELSKTLKEKNLALDKPLAFLLNPPYKNTDENEKNRESTEANYEIHPDILALTGEDAGKERYLAFLAQILLICKEQVKQYPDFQPLLMIFTPTSWLIPRPTYVKFREIFDAHFEYKAGFLTTSNEFFKLDGRWPVAFTVWQFRNNIDRVSNFVNVYDFTQLTQKNLLLNWNEADENLDLVLNYFLKNAPIVKLNNERGDIRNYLSQTRYDYSHAKKEKDEGKLVSGFPLKFEKGHFILKRKCGSLEGNFIGFMEDNTPVRLTQDTQKRMSQKPDRVWFMLMSAFSSINLSQIHSGAANSRSYCAYDLASAQVLFSWFGISKAINGRYPVWANQYDLWAVDFSSPNPNPSIALRPPKEKGEINLKQYFYSLCYAFALAENRCVVTKFEANNPVSGAPEVFVDNPLCPANRESFWALVLDKEIVKEEITPLFLQKSEQLPLEKFETLPKVAANLALGLVEAVKNLYRYWNMTYCKGQFLYDVGLKEEAYFKYFDYPDFVTPYSGLVQIKKYAEVNGASDLQPYFEKISTLTKQVREEIYFLLTEVFGYFR
jgi:hypothetical protein